MRAVRVGRRHPCGCGPAALVTEPVHGPNPGYSALPARALVQENPLLVKTASSMPSTSAPVVQIWAIACRHRVGQRLSNIVDSLALGRRRT